jgi:hypothetical protein
MILGVAEDTLKAEIKICVDTEPLMLFIKLVKSILQIRKGRINFPHSVSELARIKVDPLSTDTSKITIIFYPSDAFLRFISTLWASDFNFKVVKEIA